MTKNAQISVPKGWFGDVPQGVLRVHARLQATSRDRRAGITAQAQASDAAAMLGRIFVNNPSHESSGAMEMWDKLEAQRFGASEITAAEILAAQLVHWFHHDQTSREFSEASRADWHEYVSDLAAKLANAVKGTPADRLLREKFEGIGNTSLSDVLAELQDPEAAGLMPVAILNRLGAGGRHSTFFAAHVADALRSMKCTRDYNKHSARITRLAFPKRQAPSTKTVSRHLADLIRKKTEMRERTVKAKNSA